MLGTARGRGRVASALPLPRLTFGVQHLEVVHGHLQDLGLFQLGGALLLEGGGHEPPQLGERRVDAVPAPLLDHPAPLLAGQQLAAVRLVAVRRAPADRTSTLHQHPRHFRTADSKGGTDGQYCTVSPKQFKMSSNFRKKNDSCIMHYYCTVF